MEGEHRRCQVLHRQAIEFAYKVLSYFKHEADAIYLYISLCTTRLRSCRSVLLGSVLAVTNIGAGFPLTVALFLLSVMDSEQSVLIEKKVPNLMPAVALGPMCCHFM
jgi:hypothetical protein